MNGLQRDDVGIVPYGIRIKGLRRADEDIRPYEYRWMVCVKGEERFAEADFSECTDGKKANNGCIRRSLQDGRNKGK